MVRRPNKAIGDPCIGAFHSARVTGAVKETCLDLGIGRFARSKQELHNGIAKGPVVGVRFPSAGNGVEKGLAIKDVICGADEIG